MFENDPRNVFENDPPALLNGRVNLSIRKGEREDDHALGDGGFKYVLFSPRTLGKIFQFDEHIFQMGWFNHQLVQHY